MNYGVGELTKQQIEVLKFYKLNGVKTLISTNEINDLLNIKTNSFEGARQQRSRDIKTINEYFFTRHQIEEAILRKKSELDKRITYYGLNEKAYKLLNKFK